MQISPRTKQALGGLFIFWQPINMLVGRLGDIDTICSLFGNDQKWCSSSSVVGRIMTGSWWESITILGGVALIIWGERERTTSHMKVMRTQLDEDRNKISRAIEQGEKYQQVAEIFLHQERLARCAEVEALCENALSSFVNAYGPCATIGGYGYKAANHNQGVLQSFIVGMGYPSEELSANVSAAERNAKLDPLNCQLSEEEQSRRWTAPQKQNYAGQIARIHCMIEIAKQLAKEKGVLTIGEALARLSLEDTESKTPL